jgi:flagellar motility protein MotE (MotC chaperone)
MRSKGHFPIGPWVITVIFSTVLLKLILAAGTLLSQPAATPELFAPAEVLAKDQKKDVPQPTSKTSTAKPPTPTPSAVTDGVKTSANKPSPSSPADMATTLEQKDAELRRKEQRLQEQEQYLSQMQKDVEQKMQELISIQKEIQAYRHEKAESKNANIRSLAQIYGSMKPKEAAKLLENMDEKLVVTIISTMKSNEAAEILSTMDFKKAAKVSEALTRR